MGVLMASEEQHYADHSDIWCLHEGCSWSACYPDKQSAWDALRRHSYDKHNPESKPYPYDEEE